MYKVAKVLFWHVPTMLVSVLFGLGVLLFLVNDGAIVGFSLVAAFITIGVMVTAFSYIEDGVRYAKGQYKLAKERQKIIDKEVDNLHKVADTTMTAGGLMRPTVESTEPESEWVYAKK